MNNKFYLATLKYFTSIYESTVIPVGLFTTPEEARNSLFQKINRCKYYHLCEVDEKDPNCIFFYTHDIINDKPRTFLGVTTELQLGAICINPHAF